MKHRIFIFLLLLAMVFALPALAEYRTLQQGDSGEDVLALKNRMYELGYFTNTNFSSEYNKITVERVKRLQKANGLEETGIATVALQELIFSDEVKDADGKTLAEHSAETPSPKKTKKPTATPKPTAIPKPTVAPVTEPETPKRNDAGFLTEDTEYVFADETDGHWLYLSDTLQVEIKRYADPNAPLVWFETDIKVTGDERMQSLLTGKKYYSPVKIAQDNQAVLAFTDDFFGYRVRQKQAQGILVRNSEILSDKTKREGASGFPKLETLAYFTDGHMKCYNANDHTAQEYLDMGATDVLAFGPILVTNGELGEHMTDETYYHYREPRCALGMIEPNHYLLLVVKGRSDDSKGAYLSWLAEKMLSLGAQEALNLDGGGTVALVFMGDLINKKSKELRNVTSLLSFGSSALVTTK